MAAWVLRSNEAESVEMIHARQVEATMLRLQKQQQDQHRQQQQQQQQLWVRHSEVQPFSALEQEGGDKEQEYNDDNADDEEGDDTAEEGQEEENDDENENGNGKYSRLSEITNKWNSSISRG